MVHAKLIQLFLLLGILVATIQADESRAIVDDTVSRQHHEAIEPEPDSHEEPDDGPLVLPVSYHHDINSLLKDKPPDKKGGFKMASLKLEYVGTPFLIALWMFIAGLTKIGEWSFFFKKKKKVMHQINFVNFITHMLEAMRPFQYKINN